MKKIPFELPKRPPVRPTQSWAGIVPVLFRSRAAGYTIVNSELTTYTTGLTTELSETQLENLDTFITALKTGNSLTNLSDDSDVMILFAGETEESSLKNLVKDAHHASVVVQPTWTQFEGYEGNATDQYLQVDYVASTGADKYAQNDACIIVLQRKDIAYSATKTIFGAYKNAAVPYSGILLNTLNAANSARAGINYARNHSSLNLTTNINDRRGYWALNRLEAATCKLYRNKTEIVTQTATSAALSDKKPLILASLIDDLVAHFSDEQIAFFYMGKGKTPEQMNVIIDAVEAYMDANEKGML